MDLSIIKEKKGRKTLISTVLLPYLSMIFYPGRLMYCKCTFKKKTKLGKKLFFVGILEELMKRAGSESASQWYGSADPDPNPNPYQNVTDPQTLCLTLCQVNITKAPNDTFHAEIGNLKKTVVSQSFESVIRVSEDFRILNRIRIRGGVHSYLLYLEFKTLASKVG
jgi:hypothetical protein